MRLSNRQKAAIHQAAQAAGYDDARRKIVQRTVGGFESCADEVTREGFIRVMAYFEAECKGQLPGYTPWYWRGEDRRSNSGTSLLYACRRVATEMGWTEAELDAFMAGPQMSGGKAPRIAGAPPYWLSRCLTALKAIRGRKAAPAAPRPQGPPGPPHAATGTPTRAYISPRDADALPPF